MHMRGVEPHEERCARRMLALGEVARRRKEFVIDGLHALFGQRSGVLDALCAVRVGPAVQYATRAIVLSEIRKVLLRRIIAQLRLLLGVQVVEVAKELVEAMLRRQVLVAVAEVILAELAGGIAEGFEQFGNSGIFRTHAHGSAWQSDLTQTRAEYALAHNERRTAGGTALLGVVVGENHALVSDAVDIRGAVSHHALRIGTDVRLADVVTPDDEHVRLPRSLFCHWALLCFCLCCNPSPGLRPQPLITSCPGAWHAVVTLCPATLPLFATLVNAQMTIGKGDSRRSRPPSLQRSCQRLLLLPRE